MLARRISANIQKTMAAFPLIIEDARYEVSPVTASYGFVHFIISLTIGRVQNVAIYTLTMVAIHGLVTYSVLNTTIIVIYDLNEPVPFECTVCGFRGGDRNCLFCGGWGRVRDGGRALGCCYKGFLHYYIDLHTLIYCL